MINLSKFADSVVELLTGDIIETKNFATYMDHCVIIGFKYIKSGNLFVKPIESSMFGVSCIRKSDNILKMFDIKAVKRKIMVLPYAKLIYLISYASLGEKI